MLKAPLTGAYQVILVQGEAKHGGAEKADAVFIGAEYEENLSIRMLASSVREKGYSAALLPFNRDGESESVVEAVLSLSPALVGLSMAFQHRAPEFLHVARRLRERGYRGHICAGGHFPTATYEDTLARNQAVDTIISHDGEEGIGLLMDAVDDRKKWREVPGMIFREEGGKIRCNALKPVPKDLDVLPWPARDGNLRVHVGRCFTSLMGSRGCFGGCRFCAIHSYCRTRPGPRLRFRSPGDIAREMAFLYREREARIFCFHDDTWFLPHPGRTQARLGELARRLKELGVGKIAVVAKCRPDSVTPGLVRFLGDGIGLVRMYVGIENFSPRGLEHLGRNLDRDAIEKSLEAFLSAGIYCCYNILLFEPDTVLEDIRINLDAIEKHRAVPFNMARTEIYNGTAMWVKLKQEGRLRGNYLATDYEIGDPSAEAMFRIFAEAFKDRFFSLDSLSNMNSSLGYEVKLLGHFAEGEGAKAAREMKREVEDLTVAINMDTLAHLREACEFARRGGWKNKKDMVEFTIDLARKVNFSGARLYSKLLSLRQGLGV